MMGKIKECTQRPTFLLTAIFTTLMIICSIVNCVITYTASNLFTTIAIVALIPVCVSLWYMYFVSKKDGLASNHLNMIRKSLFVVLIGEVISDIGLVVLIVSNHSTWFQGLRPNYNADSVVIEGNKMELFTSVETTIGDTTTTGFETALNLAPIVVTILSAALILGLAYFYIKSLDKTLASVQDVLDGKAEETHVSGFTLFMVSLMVVWGALSVFMYGAFMGVFGMITGIVSVIYYGLIAISVMHIAPPSEMTAEEEAEMKANAEADELVTDL